MFSARCTIEMSRWNTPALRITPRPADQRVYRPSAHSAASNSTMIVTSTARSRRSSSSVIVLCWPTDQATAFPTGMSEPE